MTKRIGKLINFPPDLIRAIEKYREQNFLPSFTSAVINLLKKVLQEEELL